MKHTSRFTMLMLTVLLVGVGGCTPVTTLHPIGQPVVDPEAFTGVWEADDDAVWHVRAHDDGTLTIAQLGWEQDAFALIQFRGVVVEHDDRRYLLLNLLDFDRPGFAPPDAGAEYVFFRLIPGGDDRWVLFLPNEDTFVAAIKSGTLAGRELDDKDGGDRVQVGGEPGDLEAFLDPEALGTQFHTDEGLILRRIE